MTEALQIGNRTITASELISLLASYQMLPQLQRELIIDEAIEQNSRSTNVAIEFTPEEVAQAKQQFYAEKQLKNEEDIQAWMARQGLTYQQLEAITTRKLKIEKFKQATWGNKLESYFFQSKSKLDKVIYSLLRTQDVGIAQELYFRIQAKENSFADLAREYSLGPEAQTGGLVGPVELNALHPVMVQMLSSSQPGQILPPTRIAEWFVILRLEKFIPAQLDEFMKARLLNELFETWLQEQQKQIMSAQQEQAATQKQKDVDNQLT
ncbi:peptidylprolyl isomerase [Nostoc sp. FACHB-973]|uniref:peptidylprolyl isomerase n=1 Tax=Desmonostoc muscorum LEGE 12446 TaxID=1828758 RepID=A0A8J7DH08_DESMC|nr:peptidylprolyl isomerase [Desmonostoc muscorum]MBD2520242.1 peptidylprolyl isomerase [Nostoc sp. FACHB-973]MBX9255664.1 peptidylprolyl isomerase [Desmonostoc muscorum CCALA 125]MCF2150647.1 peptidylprolyl isomerase [Desmonostoc muscorum LEGE 12446]